MEVHSPHWVILIQWSLTNTYCVHIVYSVDTILGTWEQNKPKTPVLMEFTFLSIFHKINIFISRVFDTEINFLQISSICLANVDF